MAFRWWEDVVEKTGGGGAGPTGPPPGDTLTDWYSVQDRHQLTEAELSQSNMVVGSDGFVYQVGWETDPLSPTGEQYAEFGLAPKWIQESVLGEAGGFGGPSGPSGPSPEQLAIERSKVHSQNMATFLDATVAELDAEIASDRLNLDQAEAEFNRRMDAFSEGGKQMEGMWQWTSQPGTETIHTGLREKLGMEPWKSAAIPFDPFAMAWDIVEQTPEIVQTQPDFDPLQQAIDLAGQFV